MHYITFKIAIPFLITATFMAANITNAESGAGKLASGNNRFAVNLYKEISSKDGNIFFSPHSLSTALAMTYEGARGETAAEMRKTLQFEISADKLGPAFARMDDGLEAGQDEGGYQLSVANSLWGQEGHEFLPAFLDTLKKYYGAALQRVDYRKETEVARKRINTWVEDETEGRIEDLLAPGVLKPTTRLVLCNAIYFKGDWLEQFDKSQTKKETFFCSDGSEGDVPLMRQKLKCGYTENNELQAIELPYAGGDVSMVILLPKAKQGLAELEAGISAEKIEQTVDSLTKQEVQVFLPRFKLTDKCTLGQTLSSMGMPLAFSGKADFSGMDGKRDLFIDEVVHKAFVEVNEEGTEAAAATGVMMKMTALPSPPKVFRADHPFLFIIKENNHNSILFMGRMTKP